MGNNKFIFYIFKISVVLVLLVMVFFLAVDLIIQLSEELNAQSQKSSSEIALGLIKNLDNRSLYFIEASIIIGCALSISSLHNANTLNLLRMLGKSPQKIIFYIAILPCVFAALWIFINFANQEFEAETSQRAHFVGNSKILVDLKPRKQLFLYEVTPEKGITKSIFQEETALKETITLNQSQELSGKRSNLEAELDLLIPLTSLILIYFIGSMSFISKRNITTGSMIALSLSLAFALSLIKNLLISLSIILNFSPVVMIGILATSLYFYTNRRFRVL